MGNILGIHLRHLPAAREVSLGLEPAPGQRKRTAARRRDLRATRLEPAVLEGLIGTIEAVPLVEFWDGANQHSVSTAQPPAALQAIPLAPARLADRAWTEEEVWELRFLVEVQRLPWAAVARELRRSLADVPASPSALGNSEGRSAAG